MANLDLPSIKPQAEIFPITPEIFAQCTHSRVAKANVENNSAISTTSMKKGARLTKIELTPEMNVKPIILKTMTPFNVATSIFFQSYKHKKNAKSYSAQTS